MLKMAARKFKIGLIQMAVGESKQQNIAKAVQHIKEAKQNGADIVALPECFNSPYGTKYFPQYAETVPDGETSKALSQAAREHNVYIVGGSFPEREGEKYYNTCTLWNRDGTFFSKHQKVHLFDIDIPGGVRFMESETLSPGNNLTVFETTFCKIGIGICYDMRFNEMAQLYRKKGCEMILYPGAFNMTTGPLHWELLQRARAVDQQVFVASVAPAQDKSAGYVSYGHTQVVNPWGKVIADCEFAEAIVYADIDLKTVDEIREQIPTFKQRRIDLYDTISLK